MISQLMFLYRTRVLNEMDGEAAAGNGEVVLHVTFCALDVARILEAKLGHYWEYEILRTLEIIMAVCCVIVASLVL